MLMLATAGLKPCEITDGLTDHRNGCRLCESAADGYDAAFDGPLCNRCATAFSTFYEEILEDRND